MVHQEEKLTQQATAEAVPKLAQEAAEAAMAWSSGVVMPHAAQLQTSHQRDASSMLRCCNSRGHTGSALAVCKAMIHGLAVDRAHRHSHQSILSP